MRLHYEHMLTKHLPPKKQTITAFISLYIIYIYILFIVIYLKV